MQRIIWIRSLRQKVSQSSLRSKVLKGSLWTIGGDWVNHSLHLTGNLILTRLLFPEAFGLMSLVSVFMTGLQLFSDIGIKPSIIQNKRGNDSKFLNTAWTIQVIRGFFLWIGACLIAIPASHFYDEPMLRILLPVVGVNAIISGFNSTKIATATRQLTLGRLTFINQSSYFVSIVVMIIGAYFYQSVWPLVVGGLLGTIIKMILSHSFLEGENNYFFWDAESFKAIQKFGRWIFLSTALTFIAGQGDRLLLGYFFDTRLLGIYTVAHGMISVCIQLVKKLGGEVLFASYSELIREQPKHLYNVIRKGRITLICFMWSISLSLIFFGQNLIDLLYDDRYFLAGWMIQLLAIGSLVGILETSNSGVLMAKGLVNLNTLLLSMKVILKIIAMMLGYHWWGTEGVIIGLATSDWIIYPVMAILFARIKLWQPEVDIPVIALAGLIVIVKII